MMPVEDSANVIGKQIVDREEWYSPQVQDGEIVEQETTAFIESDAPRIAPIDYSDEEISSLMAMDKATLAAFLSRPVKIDTTDYALTDTRGATLKTLYPWQAFLNNAKVEYKLHNWSFIRCNLKVRILFNASPFYYGSLMVVYQPLHTYKVSSLSLASLTGALIPRSQMYNVKIYPQDTTTVEMTLPFFYPLNFLPINVSADAIPMGMLKIIVLDPLRSANGAVGTVATVSTYAWAEDVVLSGPTVSNAMQDGTKDEYMDSGPVSKPASAIANVAAKLSMVPVIGPFATATAIGATAVANIAKLFGYTNVPVIDDQHGFEPRPFPCFASTEIGFPIDKLTVDAKNELTIDHRSVGLGAEDELPIMNLVTKESYLTSFDWSTASAEGAVLFNSAVSPAMYKAEGDTNFHIYMTTLAWVNSMFRHWSGDIIFRFKIVASKYHRGRLLFAYDPTGDAGANVSTIVDTTHITMTRIIDLSESNDIEIRVPYQQAYAWCANTAVNTWTNTATRWSSTPGFKHVSGQTNGMFAISVLNLLTAPVASSTVSIQVFVRGADNFDVANPTSVGIAYLSGAEIQDGTVPGDQDTTAVSLGADSRPIDHLYLTYMGERIGSLRVLLRRMCGVYTLAPPDVAATLIIHNIVMQRQPPPFGYCTNGFDSAKGIVAPGTDFAFNWTNGNFLSYVSQAYVGNRGSVNWSCNLEAGYEGSVSKSLTVVRAMGAPTNSQTTDSTAGGSMYSDNRFLWTKEVSLGSGAAITNQLTNSGLTWQMPFYSNSKFAPASFTAGHTTSGLAIGSMNDSWQLQTSFGSETCPMTSVKFRFYAGAGTDYDLLYFLHVPVYTVFTNTPTST